MNFIRCAGMPTLCLVLLTISSIPARADTPTASIKQVAVYHDTSRHELFEIYANTKQHTAATHPASGTIRYVDPTTGKLHSTAQVGLELQGFYLANGEPGLVAKVLEIQKDERIVLQWINAAWTLALTESETSDVPSIVSLEFTDTTVGADITLTQIGVPTYQIAMTSSPFNPHGEVGPLSEIIRVHWELAYWQPIRRYLASRPLEK